MRRLSFQQKVEALLRITKKAEITEEISALIPHDPDEPEEELEGEKTKPAKGHVNEPPDFSPEEAEKALRQSKPFIQPFQEQPTQSTPNPPKVEPIYTPIFEVLEEEHDEFEGPEGR